MGRLGLLGRSIDGISGDEGIFMLAAGCAERPLGTTGVGGSKTPTANHRRPCLWEAPLWPNVGPQLGQALGLRATPAAVETLGGTLGGG